MNQRQMGSRRQFLRESGLLLGGSWLGVTMPALMATAQVACARRDSAAGWSNLSDAEAETLSAVADQIIPPDETPGASEAGVVYFIDEALNGFMQGAGGLLSTGVASLDTRAGRNRFVELPFDAQTAILKDIENTPFFQTMLMLVQAGMFALPAHGGNRGGAGWELIGFEHRHVWQAPYGYYDAEAAERGGANHGD